MRRISHLNTTHLVSVFVRHNEVHSFLQQLSERFPSPASQPKVFTFDKSDELVVVNHSIIVQINFFYYLILQWLRNRFFPHRVLIKNLYKFPKRDFSIL